MDDLQNSENGRRFLKKLQKSFSRVMSDEKSKIRKEYRRRFDKEKTKLEKLYRKNTAVRVEARKVDDSNKIVKEIGEIYENTCMLIKNVDKEDELFLKSLEVDHQKKVAEITKKSQAPIEILRPKARHPQENSKNAKETPPASEESLKRVNPSRAPESNFKLISEKFKFDDDELENPKKHQGTSKVNPKPPPKLKISETKLTLPSHSDFNLNDCRQIHAASSSSEAAYSSKSFEDDETDDNN